MPPLYRLIISVILALSYLGIRNQPAIWPRPITPAVAPVAELVALVRTMSVRDRTALREAYQILARSIDADPPEEPVFDTVLAIRQAHRAALLCVWRGVLDNPPGKYPGLREALEECVHKRLGSDDAAVSPPIRQDAVAVLNEIAGTLQ